jgi:hypothetical protein
VFAVVVVVVVVVVAGLEPLQPAAWRSNMCQGKELWHMGQTPNPLPDGRTTVLLPMDDVVSVILCRLGVCWSSSSDCLAPPPPKKDVKRFCCLAGLVIEEEEEEEEEEEDSDDNDDDGYSVA